MREQEDKKEQIRRAAARVNPERRDRVVGSKSVGIHP